MHTHLKLAPEALKLNIDLGGLEETAFNTDLNAILGQPRAQSALEFGIAMTSSGYNIFVMGEPGLARISHEKGGQVL